MPRRKLTPAAAPAAAAPSASTNEVRRSVPIVAPRSMIDSGDTEVARPGAVELNTAGDASDALTHPQIEVPDGPMGPSRDQLENLAFANELVTVLVAEQTEQYPEPCVSTWNNGRHQLFPRGVEVTCKRKFLEILARSKPIRYTNQEYVDAEGVRKFRYPRTFAVKYPFVVVRDDNQLGRPWIKRLLQEAV